MLFDDSYKTIREPSSGIYKEKRSHFLGLAFPVTDEKEVKAILNEQKKEHYQANHHCYAFRLGPDRTHFRFSDDREPSGTAGKPILNQILSAGLSDILIIVVRYFGGSLLGIPGLIKAYQSAAKDAIDHATIIQKTMLEMYRITFGFEIMNEVMGLLKAYNANIIRQETTDACIIDFEIQKSKADELIGKLRKIYKATNPPEINTLNNNTKLL